MRQVLVVYSPACQAQLNLALRLNTICKDQPYQVKLLECAQPHQWATDPNQDLVTNLGAGDVILDLCHARQPSCDRGNHHPLYLVLGSYWRGWLQLLSSTSGFRQVAERSPATELALVTSADGQTWKTLMHAAIPSQRNWRFNQQQLIHASADYAALWLWHYHNQGRCLQLGKPVPCHGVATVYTSDWARLWQKFRYTYERIRLRIQHWLKGQHTWQIGWEVSGQHHQKTRHQIRNQADLWFADPFPWEDEQKRRWIFCEQLDEAGDRIGRIGLFELTNSQLPHHHGVILAEKFHLSFPRLVATNGHIYATVESGENKDVRLYETQYFPYQWTLKRILLAGEAFIDPMLLRHDDGRWYLFVSTCSISALRREVAPELRLFHANDLLNDKFEEHPLSPLLISSRGGRNAGLLRQNGLVRVAQLTGFGGIYGESVALFRIDELSPTSYRETPIDGAACGLDPNQLRRVLKTSHLHTLNEADGWFVYDFTAS